MPVVILQKDSYGREGGIEGIPKKQSRIRGAAGSELAGVTHEVSFVFQSLASQFPLKPHNPTLTK